ncbi:MAG: DUF4249 family protein, partial [Pricia sp.]
MRLKYYILFGCLVVSAMLLRSCIEPFEVESDTFENVLIVEATLTDETKNQRVVLRRATPIDEEGPDFEQNAQVSIIEDNGNEYTFNEINPGIYQSDAEFSARPNLAYTLQIKTSNGNSYRSSPSQLETQTVDDIENLYADRTVNGFGQEGISVFVDNVNTDTNAKYYRYEYVETYRVIAPLWVSNDLVEVPPGSFQLILAPKEQEEQVCYRTERSNAILLTSTTSLSENQLT